MRLKFIILIYFTMIGCLLIQYNIFSNEQEDFKKEKRYQNIQQDKIAYTKWLKDTLILINKWKLKREDCIMDKEVKVNKDATLLTINTFYTYNNSKSKCSKVEISNILELLKEYEEFPKNNFEISFLYSKKFYPSNLKNLKYEFQYDIIDLKIKQNNLKTFYYFNRGSLTGKKVVTIKNNKIIKTKNFDFIWEGNNLHKKILSQ